ncbi:hypothetical protein GCM10023238_16690 [Streptomyces heliomycini]
MLVHLSADRSNMSVVSMPRDTLLEIPKCTDPEDGTVYPASDGRTMTNQSLGHGGPGCTVATWQELTGIHIDHIRHGRLRRRGVHGGRGRRLSRCASTRTSTPATARHGSGLKLEEGTNYVQGRAGPAVAAHPLRLRGRQ